MCRAGVCVDTWVKAWAAADVADTSGTGRDRHVCVLMLSGAYAYDCPGEALLDVSWHVTANAAPGQLNAFLMEPNLATVVGVSGIACAGKGVHARACVCVLIKTHGMQAEEDQSI